MADSKLHSKVSMILKEIPTLLLLLYSFLLAALLISTAADLRFRRIPNIVTFSTIVIALLLHSLHAGLAGLLFSLKGLGLGFCLLLLPHLLGGIGAGDVKLMAAVGAVLGVEQTLLAFLIIAIIGGLTSLVMLASRRQLRATMRQMASSFFIFCGGAGLSVFKVDRATLRRDGIPYGAVIAGGTVVFFVYQLVVGKGLPVLVP
jgi:prepilin peptidase CpaA